MMNEEDENSSFETSPLSVSEPMMTKFAFDNHCEPPNRLEDVSLDCTDSEIFKISSGCQNFPSSSIKQEYFMSLNILGDK